MSFSSMPMFARAAAARFRKAAQTWLKQPNSDCENSAAIGVGDEAVLALPGAMSYYQLRVLEYFLTRHFAPGTKLNTLETGCDRSTILFSKHATRHSVFCSNDGGEDNLILDAVQRAPGFNPNSVEIILGATPGNLFRRQHNPVDIALIGGSRTHPMPEVEYLAISSSLKKGSILILRDINIPTIQSLFQILREDESLHLTNIVENTAFFWCARIPTVGQGKKCWWAQRYNAQRLSDARTYSVGRMLPFRLMFDGWLRELPTCFKQGFMLLNGNPTSGGVWSGIEFELDCPPDGEISIALEGNLLQPKQRIKCVINDVEKGEIEVNESGPVILRYSADLAGAQLLRIQLFHPDAPVLEDLPWPAARSDLRQALIMFSAITVEPVGAFDRLTETSGTSAREGAVMSFDFGGTTLKFFVHDRNDSIQAHHAVGQLYEIEELALLAQHISPGARILDIGANIGNHTVWFERLAGASYILPIEPQPRILEHLKFNCALNGLSAVDLSQLGCALGKTSSRGSIRIAQSFNPAGAIIEHDTAGDIPIHLGDEIVGDKNFDFVKIDVESAELDVIEGLQRMIERCRPTIFVEVAEENADHFRTLIDKLEYEIADEYRRYEQSVNYLIKPKKSNAA